MRHIRSGVAAAGNKRYATLLRVGDSAVFYQEPPRPKPDGGEVLLGPIKRGGEAIEGGNYTRSFLIVRASAGRIAGGLARCAPAVRAGAASGITQTADVRIVVIHSVLASCRRDGVGYGLEFTGVAIVADAVAIRRFADI